MINPGLIEHLITLEDADSLDKFRFCQPLLAERPHSRRHRVVFRKSWLYRSRRRRRLAKIVWFFLYLAILILWAELIGSRFMFALPALWMRLAALVVVSVTCIPLAVLALRAATRIARAELFIARQKIHKAVPAPAARRRPIRASIRASRRVSPNRSSLR